MRHWRGPRRKLTAEETAENAHLKAEREKAAMHCQCCGRLILANTGKIAHHGYERPGSGWQTASCMGAKFPPFEASRDQLGYMTVVIKGMIATHEKHIDEVESERAPADFEWSVPRLDENGKPKRNWQGMREYQQKSHEVTRADFDAGTLPDEVKKAISDAYLRSFDEIKSRHLAPWKRRLEDQRLNLKEQTKRYEGWKRTHEWKDKAWKEAA